MKKAVLFVAVFLTGITTQTFAQQNNVIYKPGTNNRYYDSQEISFVENGVLYLVNTIGTFHFREISKPYPDLRSRRNYNTIYYPSAPGHVNYIHNRRDNRSMIRTDQSGRIRAIGETTINYQRNGKVKRIGGITMQYHRGRLIRIGNMQIEYNRRGLIRNTIGYINRFNQRDWHEDWYTYNNDFDDDWFDYRDRKRKKKI